jgi:hypothetical protein
VTISGEGLSEVISQAAPTACIHPPMLDTTFEVHNERKSGSRSGAQGDCIMLFSSEFKSGP